MLMGSYPSLEAFPCKTTTLATDSTCRCGRFVWIFWSTHVDCTSQEAPPSQSTRDSPAAWTGEMSFGYKINPQEGERTGYCIVIHTPPHVLQQWLQIHIFSTLWQQILFTRVHIHTPNYSIRTLFSTQKSFDRKCSICPNQRGLSISQNIFLNWLHQYQSGRINSFDNLTPKAGTDLSGLLLLFFFK